jgi:hypothetical protein
MQLGNSHDIFGIVDGNGIGGWVGSRAVLDAVEKTKIDNVG